VGSDGGADSCAVATGSATFWSEMSGRVLLASPAIVAPDPCVVVEASRTGGVSAMFRDALAYQDSVAAYGEGGE
jgi:hypothetical protein